jgi:hypothetical protein
MRAYGTFVQSYILRLPLSAFHCTSDVAGTATPFFTFVLLIAAHLHLPSTYTTDVKNLRVYPKVSGLSR